MLFSENYLRFVKEVPALMDYEVVSIDDLALMPRKISFSDTSSNGMASHDSGHDSYLEDGTGYSGDDEESSKCDLCLIGHTEEAHHKENGSSKRKLRRRSRKSRNKKRARKLKEDRQTVVLRQLPKNDNFEFEGEKKVEMKWTLECFMDISLIPKLKRVVIDRGRPEDLGIDNLLVFDESSSYCRIQTWRQDMMLQLGTRNEKEVNAFNLLPSYLSCDSCIEQRQTEIQVALKEGRNLTTSRELYQYSVTQDKKIPTINETKTFWRKKIVNDLKLHNCRAQACIRGLKRHKIHTTSYRFGSRKRKNGRLEKVEEEDWEVYEIISDDESFDTNDFA